MDHLIDSFLSTLNSIVPLPTEELEKLREICSVKELKKGTYFLREGDKSTQIAFVVKGLFRYSYLTTKGQEFTKSFLCENDFLVSYSAILQERESYFSIEALENSSIIVIDYHQWRALFEDKVYWYELLVKILENAFVKKEQREKEFLLYDATTRYKLFIKNYPHLVDRIKQNLLSSYLGITPVALSNLKKELKN